MPSRSRMLRRPRRRCVKKPGENSIVAKQVAAAEQLHKDIATCLAAKQTAAASEGTPPWSDELVVAAIKEVRN